MKKVLKIEMEISSCAECIYLSCNSWGTRYMCNRSGSRFFI